jgi:hypothetical protein
MGVCACAGGETCSPRGIGRRTNSRAQSALREQHKHEGVANYTPDDDPAPEDVPDEPAPDPSTAAGATGAAVLAALRMYPYKAPKQPDALRRAAALAPAFASLDRMAGELATLSPSTDAIDQGNADESFASALLGWAVSNGWRLDAGESTAWAGESSGFAEAATQDGQLLEWIDSGDDHECADCEVLAGMPPAPLSDWPCQPGDGVTECHSGCRCSLDVSDQQVVPGDTYDPTQLGAWREIPRDSFATPVRARFAPVARKRRLPAGLAARGGVPCLVVCVRTGDTAASWWCAGGRARVPRSCSAGDPAVRGGLRSVGVHTRVDP